MVLFLRSSIFRMIFFLFGVKEFHTYEGSCKNSEVIICGNKDSEWDICTPKTPGVSRILTAQLDTRYKHRYCRKNGTPENYGLSITGRSMWTVGWCYGTFFLCLEIDLSNESTESTEDKGNGLGSYSPKRNHEDTDHSNERTEEKGLVAYSPEKIHEDNDGNEISIAAGAIAAIVIGTSAVGVLLGVGFTLVVLKRTVKEGLKKNNQHQPTSVPRQSELNVSSLSPNTYEQLQNRTDTESRMSYDSLDASATSSARPDRQLQYESLKRESGTSHTYVGVTDDQ